MVITQRYSFGDSWQSIHESIQSSLSIRCTINPLSNDKALMHVYNKEISANLCRNTEWVTVDSKRLKFLPPSSPASFKQLMVASYGGWIDIYNLLPTLWTDKIFKHIGDSCGGYLHPSNQTERGIILSFARLKIKGNNRGYIPLEIHLPKELTSDDITSEYRP